MQNEARDFQHKSASSQRNSAIEDEYVLNLIDTPGHPDFSYEVSRALEAVEGAILLVDATQGIQAQTLSNFYAAQKAGLTIIGAINKIDMPNANIEATTKELSSLLGVAPDTIHKISAKTGEGVKELLREIITIIPPPEPALSPKNATAPEGRAMIFDSFYDDHKGIIASVRVFNGECQKGVSMVFAATKEHATAKEVGYFVPQLKNAEKLGQGEVGFVITGSKDPNKINIGDTLLVGKNARAVDPKIWMLPGYQEPRPVVFVSFFPEDADAFDDLKNALGRLRLNDSAFVFEPDFNEVLGRGFKGGFLGKLHFEIVLQRLEKEFNIITTTSFPSVEYLVKTDEKMPSGVKKDENGYYHIKNANNFPYNFIDVLEPMIRVKIVLPSEYLGSVMQLQDVFRFETLSTENLGDRILLEVRMPLSELIADFDDKLKSVSNGFASFSYSEDGYKKADLVRVDVFVAGEIVPGLSIIVVKKDLERTSHKMAKKLKEVLPKQQFSQAIQVKALGKIIARETIPALKKDVTGHLYGGDRTRKMKLWKKQKEGKKKLKSMAKVRISAEDFKKLLSK